MYCKAGVACTNPEVYGDIKRGRRLAPSKGITCPRCQGKCCNDACLEKHKCKQRARPSTSVHGGMRGLGNQRNWHLDPTMAQYDAAALGITDPNMLAALSAAGLRGGQGGLLLQGSQQFAQPIMLGAGPGGSLMPIIQVPMLPMMFPGMQQGAEGAADAAQLQAALAAMQQSSGGMVAGGASAPMLLASLPGQEGGTPTAQSVAGASQALQFAQLQGLGGTQLLQLTTDGSGGLANGQRLQLQLPAGLMQNMHMLPGGLQILSAEGLQLTTDANGNMQMMSVLPQDGSVTAADQATLEAAAAAQAGLPLMLGGNVIDPNALAAAMSAAAAAGENGEQTAVMMDQSGAPDAAEMAAHHGIAVDHAALQNALEAAAGTTLQMQGPMSQEAAAPTGVPAEVAAQVSQPEQQQAFPEAATSAAATAAVPASAELPVPVLTGTTTGEVTGPAVSALPAIAPLTMSPAIAEALKAVASGRPPNYNAEEDAAAAALMSLATDKKKKAEELMRQAEAAVAAAQNGIIPHAAAEAAVQEAQRLKAEAEAEEAAAAAEAKLAQAQHEQQALQQLQEQQQLALQQLAQQQLAAQQAGLEQPQLTQEQLEQVLQQQAALQQQALEQQHAMQQQQQEALEEQQKALLQQHTLEMQHQATLQQQSESEAAQQNQHEQPAGAAPGIKQELNGAE